MNEASETLTKYFSDDSNTVQYFGSNTFVTRFAEVLITGPVIEYDAPDMYIKAGNELWILEHFEFDCFKANRNGSSYEREKNRIDKAELKLIPDEEGVVFHDTIDADSSYADYVDNVTKSFRSHYNKIEQYKKNLINDKIANEDTEFKVLFLIDDVSPLGSMYVDGKGKCSLIVLPHSREFLQLLEKSPLVDGVLAVSCGNDEKIIWFIDRNQLDDYYNKAEDYVSCRFIDYKPHVVGFKIAIPDEAITDSLEVKE